MTFTSLCYTWLASILCSLVTCLHEHNYNLKAIKSIGAKTNLHKFKFICTIDSMHDITNYKSTRSWIWLEFISSCQVKIIIMLHSLALLLYIFPFHILEEEPTFLFVPIENFVSTFDYIANYQCWEQLTLKKKSVSSHLNRPKNKNSKVSGIPF